MAKRTPLGSQALKVYVGSSRVKNLTLWLLWGYDFFSTPNKKVLGHLFVLRGEGVIPICFGFLSQNKLWFLILICLGSGTRYHHWRYLSAISKWFEIMSSYLVTFNFKTFQSYRQTQFWNFLAQIWEIGWWRQVVSINFDKKIGKIWFFQFFFK